MFAILYLIAILFSGFAMAADDTVVSDDGEKVTIVEMKQVPKEEFVRDEVDGEIASIEYALNDFDNSTERRRQNLFDRLALLQQIKEKFPNKEENPQ